MPSIDGSLPRLAAVLVLAVGLSALVLVGYAPSSAAETSQQPIGTDAADRFASLDGVSGTVVTEITRGDETGRSVRNVTLRPGTGKLRSEAVSTVRGDDLRVSNGVTTWVYDREANTAERIDRAGFEPRAERGERIEQLFERLNVTRATAEGTAVRTRGIDPLPVVPHGEGPGKSQSAVTARVDEFRVQFDGTDTVAGHEVYVVSVTATDESGGHSAYAQTLYVDTEHFYPLRTHTEWTTDGERVTTTVTYQSVTFEPDVDADAFSFEVPADATVETSGLGPAERYDSVEAVRGDATLTVPDVDLPATFDLDSARLARGPRAVQLRYSNATARVVVTRHVGGGDNLYAGEGQRVVVDGHAATYRQVGATDIVTWECDGVQYAVTGTGVPRAALLGVAASVDCG